MGQLLTICVCWSLSAVSTPADAHTNNRSIEVVQSQIRSLHNQHPNVAAIEGIYASGALLNSPDNRSLIGNKPIDDTYRKLFDAIPDAKDNIEMLEAAGNHIYVQFVLTGHWNGISDKPLEVRIMSVYKVADGQYSSRMPPTTTARLLKKGALKGGSMKTVSAPIFSKQRFTVRPRARVRCRVMAGMVTHCQA